MTADLLNLPPDLPVPMDDGACAHLQGMRMPSIALPSTTGRAVCVNELPGTTVIFAYPRTGEPDRAVPSGWDEIPGARGCTPETCGFRDHFPELTALGVQVFGLSTQDTAYQMEMTRRLRVPFPVLSDAGFALTDALKLPTFEFDGVRLLKRLTLVVRAGVIDHVFYPVFPPDRHAEEVVAWLGSSSDQ